MSASPFIPVTVVIATVIAMEFIAAIVHQHVMHGFGWRWHRSHHELRRGKFERNDLYTVVFTGFSVLLFVAAAKSKTLLWVGVGMAAYGLLYALLHEALVHRRVPFPRAPRSGYLRRLVQAHRLHHAVHERDGAVSFGFLYAPPVRRLVERLRASRGRR